MADEVRVGLYAGALGTHGWRRILEQEGIPFEEGTELRWPLTVFEGVLPDRVEGYVSRGGVAVVSGAPEADGLLPASFPALVHRFLAPETSDPCQAPSIVRLFRGEGFGECRLHENRTVREGNDPDRFPAILTRRVGEGAVIFTGIPLAQLLASAGDRLRRFSPFSEVTERVSSVDKAGVADTLVWMLREGFRAAGLPYIRVARFPNWATSVFLLRVDVDGVFGDLARRLLGSVTTGDIRASFFFNGALCEQFPGDVEGLPPGHEVGQHGYSHDVYEDVERNRENLGRGAAWVETLTGTRPRSFVAPRGLWNAALEEALLMEGYRYSSDFALDFDSLPFRTPNGLLQIPVHPYSPERASAFAHEHGLPPPSPGAVLSHYLAVLRHQLRHGRPVHVYGHPKVLGAMAEEVLPPLFAEVAAAGLPSMTLGGFYEWWRTREQAGLRLELDRKAGEVRAELSLESCAVQVLVHTDVAVRAGSQVVSLPGWHTIPGAGADRTVAKAVSHGGEPSHGSSRD